MREHSRLEMRRKLAPHAESADQVDALLDDLAARGFFSEERFVESLIRRRAERYGLRRIERELDEHRIPDAMRTPMMRELAAGERARALEVWRKRFGCLPADVAERARQHRFLAARGFDGAVIAWVFRTAGNPIDATD